MTMSAINVIICLLAGVLGGLIVFVSTKRDVTDEEFSRMQKWVNVAVTAAKKLIPDKTEEDQKKYIKTVLDEVNIDIEKPHVEAMVASETYNLEQEELFMNLPETETEEYAEPQQPPLAVDNY